MSTKVKLRLVVEVETTIADDEWESFDYKLKNDTDSIIMDYDSKVIVAEIMEKSHEKDYVLDADYDREVYILLEDGKNVFEHRNHDEIVREYGRLTGTNVIFWDRGAIEPPHTEKGMYFMSYGDPDESWDIIKGSV